MIKDKKFKDKKVMLSGIHFGNKWIVRHVKETPKKCLACKGTGKIMVSK